MDKTTEEKIVILQQDLAALTAEVYRNNFSNSQDFNKFSRFTTRLKIPHYDAVPPVGETGELIEVGGVLLICSSSNTYSVVGTQS
jgi:hypothetical protein